MFERDKNEKDIELLSSLYDGENLPKGELVQVRSDSAKKHMQNWSVIGSVMRSELPNKMNADFTDDLLAKLELEENVGLTKIKSALSTKITVDQNSVDQDRSYKLISFAKKVGVGLSQLAIAASISVVTIVGWQVYNASSYVSNYSGMETVKPTLGPVGGVNLTSYQSSSNDKVVNVNNHNVTDVTENSTSEAQMKAISASKENKEKEIDRINSYMKEFILDTASY